MLVFFLNYACPLYVKRHISTGMTESQALERVRQNDNINAKLIAKESFFNADKVINLCD